MKKIRIANSRHGDIRELHELEIGKYSTEGFKKIEMMRVGPIDDKEGEFNFIDFSGGPMIQVGSPMLEEKISAIKFEDGRYIIYTDKYAKNSDINEPQDRIQDE